MTNTELDRAGLAPGWSLIHDGKARADNRIRYLVYRTATPTSRPHRDGIDDVWAVLNREMQRQVRGLVDGSQLDGDPVLLIGMDDTGKSSCQTVQLGSRVEWIAPAAPVAAQPDLFGPLLERSIDTMALRMVCVSADHIPKWGPDAVPSLELRKQLDILDRLMRSVEEAIDRFQLSVIETTEHGIAALAKVIEDKVAAANDEDASIAPDSDDGVEDECDSAPHLSARRHYELLRGIRRGRSASFECTRRRAEASPVGEEERRLATEQLLQLLRARRARRGQDRHGGER